MSSPPWTPLVSIQREDTSTEVVSAAEVLQHVDRYGVPSWDEGAIMELGKELEPKTK
jgi:hypothetical protein